MDERTGKAVSVGFLCAIIMVFMFVDFLTEDRLYSEAENRMLASKPQWSIETVLSGKFMEEYETYVTDQFVSRDTWVELKTRGDIWLQKQEINGVYLGEDEYLIEQHLARDIQEDLVEKKIGLLVGLTERYDASVMLVPTADNILTDKLPVNAPYYDQKIFLDQVKKAIGEEHFIPVYDILKEHAEEEIYYRTDHHWTTLGAYYGYQAWKANSKATSVVTFNPDHMIFVTDQFLGTLHSRINLPRKADQILVFPETFQRIPKVTYDFQKTVSSYYEPKHLETKNKYGYFLDDNHSFIEIDTGYRRGRELILLKDSYANCIIPFFANHYDKIYVVDLRYYNGRLADLIDRYVTDRSDMLVLYNCIQFIEDFKYY